ncbi:MAG: addiction module antidote protein, HigA family [Rhodothermaeota bacterium MED-G64]|nr:MAG: addiction module antidote protein, HigA family [Rhodothermaeota bacterium MED-G64]RPF80197.1 MAG: addiction module antidote protein, HigA family [Rhodothermaceae bacterium TMED105]
MNRSIDIVGKVAKALAINQRFVRSVSNWWLDGVYLAIQRVNEIVRGKRGISPDTAWLLSEAFDTSPEFWLNLQSMHDLSANRPSKHIKSLKPVQA